MGKQALKVVAALLLLGGHAGSVCAAQAAAGSSSAQGADVTNANTVPNKIIGYTAWDDEFLYIAVQVTKPVVSGTNSKPFTDPLSDDSIVVSLQTDNDHKSTARTAKTVTIGVSEAGGTQVYLGEASKPLFNGLDDLNMQLEAISKNEPDLNVQQAKRVALLGSIPKIQVTPTGGPRAGAGDYPGYTVEIAIPWSDLGGKPETGTHFGFNVSAISKSSGSPKLQSLVGGVHGVSDLGNPSLFGELVLGASAKTGTAILWTSPRVIANKPVIDGQLSASEWNGLSGFEFGERLAAGASHTSIAATLASRIHPEYTPRPSRAAVASIVRTPAPVSPHAAAHVDQLVFARYDYDYQGDPRKEVPQLRVSNPDHSSALAHHPLDGAGPWFSFDRADWHRSQIFEIRKAGIDVILPIYRADSTHRKAYADKGLLVLTTALENLRRAGQEYPQVGLYLDTTSLVQILGDRVDLKDPAGQDLLYSAIRDFYLHVPAAFRCNVTLDPAEKLNAAYPVFLSDTSAFKDWDGAFASYVRSRFRADFGGADLVLVGPESFGQKAGLDSYFADAAAPGSAPVSGWIKTSVVSAGADIDIARYFTTSIASLTPRKSGDTYRSQWLAALSTHPDWVVVDRWNDYSLGGEVAPSLEEGFATSDLTRILTRMFNGVEKVKIKYLGNDAPSEVSVKSSFTVQVRVQNAGTESWGTGTNTQPAIAFAYRWLRGGQVVATDSSSVAAGNVLSGGNTNVAIKVQTAIKGTSLAEGDYVLEILPVGKSLVSPGRSLQIPISVHASESERFAATLIETDAPKVLENGGVYTVLARLRNDGSATWKTSEGARASARLYRVGEGALSASVPMDAADSSVLLTKDVAPGEEAVVSLLLPVMDAAGKPLPAPTSDQPYTYGLRWEISSDKSTAVAVAAQDVPRVAGAATPLLAVQVIDFDFGVRFIQDDTPAKLPGERKQPVNLGIRNAGPQTWKHESVRVGYHWYYQDGTEFLWEDETTPIPQDVPPGGSINKLLAWVTPPPCDGSYYLVWDVKFGDTWASTSASARMYDQQVHLIQVIGGRLIFADLSKAYSLAGVSDLSSPTDGDFDGKGNSFPAASIPPFTDDGVVPAGIWQAYDKSGPESPRHISFRWGSKEPKSKNFVVCHGQRLDLSKSAGKCRVLHILAAATNTNVTTNLKLIFQEPTGESEDLYAFSVSRWDQAPVNNESIVFTSSRHHSASGSQEGSVSLYHYTFVVRDPRKLVALQLPSDPNIKIAAITLER